MCFLQCKESEVCLQARFSHVVWSGSSRGEGAEEPHPSSTEPESVSSLLFPANDSTPTEQESREGGFHFRGESANANNVHDFTGT